MTISPDEKMHLKLGLLLAALLVGVVFVAEKLGPGFAVAGGAIVLGLGTEGYQLIRKEGIFSFRDAAASAAAGVILGLLYELSLAGS